MTSIKDINGNYFVYVFFINERIGIWLYFSLKQRLHECDHIIVIIIRQAYSLVDREVGYCQGSAFIAGLLLVQMPEEEAFAVFVALMQDYRLRELFKPSMAELGLCMYQLECLLQVSALQNYQSITRAFFSREFRSEYAPATLLDQSIINEISIQQGAGEYYWIAIRIYDSE